MKASRRGGGAPAAAVKGKAPAVVVLAAGDFPRKGGEPARLLAAAKHVVCCDSAADAYRRRTGREPDAVVGDLDSVRGRFTTMVRVDEQETNDLEKAVRYCRSRGWKKPVILGATGGREDHALGNVFRALALGLDVVTEEGRFVAVCGRAGFATQAGQAVSVFAPDPATKMTSKGLAWPLDGVRFENLFCATLNRATGRRVTVTADRPVSVFVEREGEGVR